MIFLDCKFPCSLVKADVTLPRSIKDSEGYLPLPFTASLEAQVHDEENRTLFFDNWRKHHERGGEPFYIKLPVYGEMQFYKVVQEGELSYTHKEKIASLKVRQVDFKKSSLVMANDVALELLEGSTATTTVSGEGIAPLLFTLDGEPINGDGSISANTFTYKPHFGFLGKDYAFYTATDETGESEVALIGITVNPLPMCNILLGDGRCITLGDGRCIQIARSN